MEKTEARIQQECIMWFHNAFPQCRGLLFEVNNNSMSAKEGSKHKSIGRVAGVSDLILLRPNANTLLIEIKTKNGKQSAHQKLWQDTVEKSGYIYIICRSLEDFKNSIYTYIVEC